ncbi:myomegalin isoform X3 [Python bivittatus]|uniref:Myomegalin isoform X3 n=1 Tax=Python bivittatus TaxID=176946 RepID=A0A9F2N9J3_PYTBI|nr:myomegalin isoform X3 [Python bivittatus]
MRESCRICGRELCGNQRRWIFHTAAKLNLQVLLSHVLGKEISRDGKNEFICSKCAFMLERIYRFDTVIARIEALSIERLQKLMLEKDRLKLCIAGIYRKNNDEPTDETADASSLPDLRYSALLQEDFAYSGFECWTEPEERVGDPQACHAAESRPRRCRGCAVLRVADADYEAICKIPRKVARNLSCGSSRCSANVCSEELPICEPVIADLLSVKANLDEESVEGETPESSLESLDATAIAGASHPKDEETVTDAKRSTACNCISDCGAHSLSLQGNRLEVALSLVKAFDCKPVQSPRGSKLPVPVKSSSHCQDFDKSSSSGFPNVVLKSQPGFALAFPLEMSDLQELWEDLCMDYVPLRTKNMCDVNQQLTYCKMSFSEEETLLNNTELMEKSCSNAMNKQLQEKLNEMNFELKSVQHTSKKQNHIIQKLNETLKSKENECEELNHVIQNQTERIAKLQDMLHKSQLGQLQNSEGCSSLQQKQQIAFLDVQNALFLTQLEVQQLKWAQQQKDRQLVEAKRTSQFLETALQEEQLQKEAAWRHNKEFCATLQQLKTDLQNKNVQCCTLEKEKLLEMHRQDQKIKHLTHSLACKEQLLQESKDLLQYQQNLDKNSTTADKMVQKLQQLIKDKDAALEQAVDEKFSALEDREQELNQLCLSMEEQDHDLKGLRQVISGNKATIQCLESLLKAKDLELEKLLAANQNLQWLIKNIEAKSHRWQSEQEGIIQQLHDRSKEVETLSATLLCNLEPGQRDAVEALHLHLQQKDQIIKELLRDKSRQVVEQVTELEDLLQALNTREQQSHIHSKKIAQALIERNCELQVLHQQLISQILQQKTETSTAQFVPQEDSIEAPRQEGSSKSIPAMISNKDDNRSKWDKDALQTSAKLERELTKAREELELLTQKERESRLELSALQSVVASQEEELQVQASDIESLTRSIQIKEELIKDLQMQLIDPEEMPAIERLTQEVLMLQEKVAKMEPQGQEPIGNKRQQLLVMLEGLVAEKNQLNETLKVEKQLYCTLVKFHAHSDSSRQEQTLQVELEKVQALRGQLEEALGRSQECLSRLESLDSKGDLTVAEDAEDASTEFTDSIEEEIQHGTHLQNLKGNIDDNLMGHSSYSALPTLKSESNQQVMLHSPKSMVQHVMEQKKKLEEELQELKEQIEEAGFSSISQLRKALLSLCLENAELKEQVGEAKLSEVWEKEDEKEDEEDLRQDIKKLQEKLDTSEIVIGLLKEQLTLRNQGCRGTFIHQMTASTALANEQQQMAKQCTCQAVHGHSPSLHCPPNQTMGSPEETQVEGGRVSSRFGQKNTESAERFQSKQPQSRQQCHKLRDRLLVSEATIQAQIAQLKQYKALLSEPMVQQDNKQIQVDIQDLGYETCGRSENEADREEATSPECRDHDEELKYWKKPLEAPLNRLAKHEAFLGVSQCDDAAVLRQHVWALQMQLQSSHKVIQNLQSCVRSVSTTSDYGSVGEQPLKLKQGYTLGNSPSHSMTDEDEGWQSDSFGTFCPSSLQPNKDLARLIQRVSLLEAHLSETKPKLLLPEELKCTVSLGKYDSLVQAQARELSHLRQMMREGQGVCHMLNQHFKDTIKSFEELLRDTDIDYYLGQSFREQLAEGNQLAGRLARKLNHRNDLNMEDKASHELLVMRMSKELQEKEQTIKTLQAKLQERSVTPSSSHTISESPRSDSSISFLSDGPEVCSDVDDLTENKISEGQVHNLLNKELNSRSCKTPAQPTCPTAAATSQAAPAECLSRRCSLHPLQITSQASRGFHGDSLSKPTGLPLAPLDSEPSSCLPLGPTSSGPRPLLGCCRTPAFSLAEAQQELQMLQKQLGESGPSISSKGSPQAFHHVPHLFHMQNSADWKTKSKEQREERCSPWCTHPLRQPREGLTSASCCSPAVPFQKLLGADFLEEHMFEIRTLCQHLEKSIYTNDHLREQLEIHLTSMAKNNDLEHLQKALLASHSKLHDSQVQLERQRTEQQRLQEEIQGKQQDLVLLQKEFLALQMNNSRLQHRVMMLQQQSEENKVLFQTQQAELRVYEAQYGPLQKAASGTHKLLLAERGIHVTGYLQDYNTLKKQILDGKTLIHQMASLLQPGLKLQDNTIFCQENIRKLLVHTTSLHQILEKSTSLLAMFWRSSPPMPCVSAPEQSVAEEIQILKAKLAEQENRVQSANHIKGSMENFILTHLTGTYHVLKKARINLEGMSQQPKSISSIGY